MLKKWEGRLILLYILNDKRYKNFIRTKGLKYLPNFLLPKFRPKIIEDLTEDNINLAKVVGINLKPVNFSEESQLEQFTKGILKIKSEEDSHIYIEESRSISIEALDYIEANTGLKFNTGDNIRIFNIPFIIKDIYHVLNKDYNSKDTLIICSDINKLKLLVTTLSEHINFITVHGIDKSIKDEVYEDIFDTTGISIFQPNNLDKVIRNYGTIINFNEILDFNLSNIRNDALILDFSRKKPLRKLPNNKKNIIIEEIGFKIGIKSSWILEPIDANLLEGFDSKSEKRFSQVFTKNDFYFIRDFINTEIKLSGRV